MPDPPLVLPFRDPRCRQVALAGGKGASLATMTAEDLPGPPGFVIASTAFKAAVDTDALRKLMRGGDAEAARAMVATAEPPKEPIERHYAELPRLGAVRCSAGRAVRRGVGSGELRRPAGDLPEHRRPERGPGQRRPLLAVVLHRAGGVLPAGAERTGRRTPA